METEQETERTEEKEMGLCPLTNGGFGRFVVLCIGTTGRGVRVSLRWRDEMEREKERGRRRERDRPERQIHQCWSAGASHFAAEIEWRHYGTQLSSTIYKTTENLCFP